MYSYHQSSFPTVTQSGKSGLRKPSSGTLLAVKMLGLRLFANADDDRDVTNPPKQITNTEAKIILVTNGLLDFGASTRSSFRSSFCC